MEVKIGIIIAILSVPNQFLVAVKTSPKAGLLAERSSYTASLPD